MLNQTSFRLVSTLLPTDMQAKTTKVINKVNAKGESYYPTFTNETVVLTNEDRTVMETAKASCRDGVLSFSKRGLSDDQSETTIEKRKLTRNPGSICFVTYGAGDTIDKDDDNTWTGKQTYTGEMVSKGSATYEGRLITKWGIEYPVFKTLEDLKKYSKAFAGMFAVVESDGELYKYNALSKLWWVVTTNNPTEIAKASKSNAGLVRIATDEEAHNGSETGTDGATLVLSPKQSGKKASTTTIGTVRGATPDEVKKRKSEGLEWELLVITPYQLWRIRTMKGSMELDQNRQIQLKLTEKGQELNKHFKMPFDGFFTVKWTEQFIDWVRVNSVIAVGGMKMSGSSLLRSGAWDMVIEHCDLYFAPAWESISFMFSSHNGSYNWSSVHNNATRAIILSEWIYIGI